MSYTLRWTTEAVKTLKQNLEYLESEWDAQVINTFLDRLEEILSMVKSNPQLYPLHRPQDGIRKCMVSKRIVLYYKVIDERYIDLLTFWNTYQNPERLKI